MSNSALLLDTHIWLWIACDESTLSKALRTELVHAANEGRLYVSAISVWEICMLESKQRISLSKPCLDWINESIAIMPLHLLALSPEICVESCHLPNDFHEDPADRIIVATARIHDLSLVTRDKNILKYAKKDYVRTIKA